MGKVIDDEAAKMLRSIYLGKANDLIEEVAKNPLDIPSFLEGYKWFVSGIALEPDQEKRLKLLSEFNKAYDPLISSVKRVTDQVLKDPRLVTFLTGKPNPVKKEKEDEDDNDDED